MSEQQLNELNIVAKVYNELLEAFVEKMENRYAVGFDGAISIMLLTIENLTDKKLDAITNNKGSEHDRKVIEHQIKEIRKTLERMLDRIGVQLVTDKDNTKKVADA